MAVVVAGASEQETGVDMELKHHLNTHSCHMRSNSSLNGNLNVHLDEYFVVYLKEGGLGLDSSTELVDYGIRTVGVGEGEKQLGIEEDYGCGGCYIAGAVVGDSVEMVDSRLVGEEEEHSHSHLDDHSDDHKTWRETRPDQTSSSVMLHFSLLAPTDVSVSVLQLHVCTGSTGLEVATGVCLVT